MPSIQRSRRTRYRANGKYLIANNVRIQLLKKKRDGGLTPDEEKMLADVTRTCTPITSPARSKGLKKVPKAARIWAHGKK